jgi:hypothetical protein
VAWAATLAETAGGHSRHVVCRSDYSTAERKRKR